MDILQIEGLGKQFLLYEQNKQIRSCQDISFTLHEGEFIGIVGLSGAGKSTILKCIHRTYLPSAGKIVYDGPSADVTEDVLNMIYAGKIPDEVEEA